MQHAICTAHGCFDCAGCIYGGGQSCPAVCSQGPSAPVRCGAYGVYGTRAPWPYHGVPRFCDALPATYACVDHYRV